MDKYYKHKKTVLKAEFLWVRHQRIFGISVCAAHRLDSEKDMFKKIKVPGGLSARNAGPEILKREIDK